MNLGDTIEISIGSTAKKGKIVGISSEAILIMPEGSDAIISILVKEHGNEPKSYRIIAMDKEGRELIED